MPRLFARSGSRRRRTRADLRESVYGGGSVAPPNVPDTPVKDPPKTDISEDYEWLPDPPDTWQLIGGGCVSKEHTCFRVFKTSNEKTVVLSEDGSIARFDGEPYATRKYLEAQTRELFWRGVSVGVLFALVALSVIRFARKNGGAER